MKEMSIRALACVKTALGRVRLFKTRKREPRYLRRLPLLGDPTEKGVTDLTDKELSAWFEAHIDSCVWRTHLPTPTTPKQFNFEHYEAIKTEFLRRNNVRILLFTKVLIFLSIVLLFTSIASLLASLYNLGWIH